MSGGRNIFFPKRARPSPQQEKIQEGVPMIHDRNDPAKKAKPPNHPENKTNPQLIRIFQTRVVLWTFRAPLSALRRSVKKHGDRHSCAVDAERTRAGVLHRHGPTDPSAAHGTRVRRAGQGVPRRRAVALGRRRRRLRHLSRRVRRVPARREVSGRRQPSGVGEVRSCLSPAVHHKMARAAAGRDLRRVPGGPQGRTTPLFRPHQSCEIHSRSRGS